ncbi:MAG TPA: aspartate kinase [Gammaproteobacteria bacterium]|nr:aspartate kinase [Gammaproteobacteria bacterium]
MNTIVQKYGGSSVATDAQLRQVAARLLALYRAGHSVVAVVSAMGDTTNRLLDQARSLNDNPPGRELDLLLSSGERMSSALLAMAIRAEGVPAVALTGAQAGIRTSGTHLSARILDVDATRVRRELQAGRIVVVAGFQGVSTRGEITTLGRGGSDTTAVALAAALGAASCDICSDVDGIYSADPRLVDGALRLPALHYDEMAALARHGAKVLDLRAVAYAKQHDVVIHARASSHQNKGTLVHGQRGKPAQVIGVASLTRLFGLELDDAGAPLADEVLSLCGSEHVYDDARAGNRRNLLISTLNMPEHEHVCGELERRFAGFVSLTRDIGSVSLVGNGAGRLSSALRTLTPAPQAQFSSADTCTCVVHERHVPDTVRALHRRFVEHRAGMAAVA